MYSNLLKPIRIGNMQLRNRIIMPAMESLFADDSGYADERWAEYMGKRAKGGFSLLTTEFVAVSKWGRAFNTEYGIWDDTFIPGLKKVADAVHEGGAMASLQLHYAGRISVVQGSPEPPFSPSPMADKTLADLGIMPTELTAEQVYGIIDEFAQGAVRAKKAGFDAVELHAGHGYLISAFLSPTTNKRTDEFGGDVLQRSTFLCKIIRAIKDACGEDYPVLLKFNLQDRTPDGNEILDYCQIARYAELAGAAALTCSQGFPGYQDATITTTAERPGFSIPMASMLKKFVNIPIIAVGRINNVQVAEAAIRAGLVDAVAMGRASLADPELPNKLASGQYEEIVPCINCSGRCDVFALPEPFDKLGVGCTMNPFSTNDREFDLSPAKTKKKVIVVGAGPGGLQAAWVLAKRGHDVTVYEKSANPGGQFRTAAIAPYKQDFTRGVRYLTHMCDVYHVDIQYNTEATEELIKAQNPDAVVLATGGVPLVPNIPGIDTANVLKAVDVLSGKVLFKGHKFIVCGGGFVGLEVADYLSTYYERDVTIVDMIPVVGADEFDSNRTRREQRFKNNNVKIYTSTSIKSMEEGIVHCEKDGEEITLCGDQIIMALGVRSYNPLESLENSGINVFKIGDCIKPRRASHAIYEATQVACKI